MNKDAFYSWIAENDNYPEHSHKWMVGVYNKYEGVEGLHRYFGPFDDKLKAREWASEYKDKYTTTGFITNIKIFPICSIVE